MAIIPLAVLLPEPPLLHRGVLEVTALDVGQGDSLLAFRNLRACHQMLRCLSIQSLQRYVR